VSRNLDALTSEGACVHRERLVARPREELDDVLSDDPLRRVRRRAQSFGVCAEHPAIGPDQTQSDAGLLEEQIEEQWAERVLGRHGC
jgi:hypothetical protein